MKKLFLIPFIACAILGSCVNNPEGKKAEISDSLAVAADSLGEKFTVNVDSSKLVWIGAKVSGQHTGTVAIKEGQLFSYQGKLSGGNFVLDLQSLNTTDLEGEQKEKLDAHLKSADFFDVEKFPVARFEISDVSVDSVDVNKLKISGNLTIKDTKKGITFDAKIVENTAHQIKLEADFNIVRADWGINYEGKKDDLISAQINFKVALLAQHKH